MGKGKIGELTRKPPASKEELGGELLGIIRQVSSKTLPTHSTLHLQTVSGVFYFKVMICV
jgi:hypothetical protein